MPAPYFISDLKPLPDTSSSNRLDETFRRLRANEELLRRASELKGTELSIQQQLRAEFDGPTVAAAMALIETRRKAANLLPEGDQLWLTRVSLEQATDWAVAQHKSQRFPSGSPVLDLCSGIGVDSAALLSRGPVTSVDSDPGMTIASRWNIDLWQAKGHISRTSELQSVVADVHSIKIDGRLIHVDPDRRCGRDRPVKRLEQYSPNLEWMQKAVETAEGGALKLGPAANFIQKFPGCQIELISVNGECREATVWFGSLGAAEPFRATSLPSGETLAADPLDAWCDVASEPAAFLFDPDPAIVRAGLVDTLGSMHSMHRMDSSEEYLTGDTIPETQFVRSFRLLADLPNNLKRLSQYLRKEPASAYEIKCRHLSVDTNRVRGKLPKGDGPPRVILFARVNGKARILVAERA